MSDNLNTSDLDKELDELEGQECGDCFGCTTHIGGKRVFTCAKAYEPGEIERMEALRELRDEVSEWHHGETLIHEDNFEDEARQVAESIGAIDSNASWPLSCIDWKQAARNLKQDYTCVEFDGETYYYRG